MFSFLQTRWIINDSGKVNQISSTISEQAYATEVKLIRHHQAIDYMNYLIWVSVRKVILGLVSENTKLKQGNIKTKYPVFREASKAPWFLIYRLIFPGYRKLLSLQQEKLGFRLAPTGGSIILSEALSVWNFNECFFPKDCQLVIYLTAISVYYI